MTSYTSYMKTPFLCLFLNHLNLNMQLLFFILLLSLGLCLLERNIHTWSEFDQTELLKTPPPQKKIKKITLPDADVTLSSSKINKTA